MPSGIRFTAEHDLRLRRNTRRGIREGRDLARRAIHAKLVLGVNLRRQTTNGLLLRSISVIERIGPMSPIGL